jgi:hypothetical protein
MTNRESGAFALPFPAVDTVVGDTGEILILADQ